MSEVHCQVTKLSIALSIAQAYPQFQSQSSNVNREN